MSLIEQIKELSNFDYCKVARLNDCDFYQFGWEGGLHFYFDDYYSNAEHEGRYIMNVWLNKEFIHSDMFFNEVELLTGIKTILCKFQK